MANLVSASRLAQLLQEVTEGRSTMSGQLSMISEACLNWKFVYPEQFGSLYDRFERARQAVRVGATDEDWAELRSSALALGNMFLIAA